MDFLIADTFTDSLARLTGDEQKAAKTTAFDLQLNPVNPGMQLHKLDRAKDRNFWSVRVGSDIRLIVHKTPGSLLLCYVDHHDKAYAWAERRKLETHPKTGAAQWVEIRESVKEILVPVYVHAELPLAAEKSSLRPFARATDEELLGYGVPAEWLGDVREATEESLLVLAERLPAEASEALLEIATGGKARTAQTATPASNPFTHPDAQRRFRTITNVDELKQALDFPWEKWTVFLHPEQRQIVERNYTGPARVTGSAGTGKTIVALHRAAHLARTNPNARVLLTTFSDALANALHTKLQRLLAAEPRLGERIDVYSLEAIGRRLHQAHIGPIKLASRETLSDMMRDAAREVGGHKFSLHFLMTEWEQVVDAWQLDSEAAYRAVARLGRKTRLPETQRTVLWSIFERVGAALRRGGLTTAAGMFAGVAAALEKGGNAPFDFAVVDEAQDISVAQLRFLVAINGRKSDGLFFAGDLGQRIFQCPFSWKAVGVDLRGRSRTLRVNYRTSHQIRRHADRLLGPAVSDVDGDTQERGDTVSVFNGPSPAVRVLGSESEEIRVVAGWLKERAAEGVLSHEVGIFVRSEAQFDRARAAATAAGILFTVLDDRVETASGKLSISTMHLAKGLEFRVVVVMACDDEIIPLQKRIEAVGDDGDLQDVYDTERQLLYVGCTRARDHLLITSAGPASEFLDDLGSAAAVAERN